MFTRAWMVVVVVALVWIVAAHAQSTQGKSVSDDLKLRAQIVELEEQLNAAQIQVALCSSAVRNPDYIKLMADQSNIASKHDAMDAELKSALGAAADDVVDWATFTIKPKGK